MDELYGRNPIREALRAGRRPVSNIWATKGAMEEPWMAGVEAKLSTGDQIGARMGTDSHQGICADAGPYPYSGLSEILARPDPLIVVLDEIQDPQNLGAIARTAESVGAAGLIIHERGAAEVTAAACKASAGALEHLRVARVRNIADALGEMKKAGVWAYGAAADGVPYLQPDYSGGVALVLGAEGKGLRPRVRSACDELVALPLHGKLDSLNVSAAAAALLYGILQSRT